MFAGMHGRMVKFDWRDDADGNDEKYESLDVLNELFKAMRGCC